MQTNTNIQKAQISYWHASKYLQHTCVSKLSLVCDMWLFDLAETGRNKDSLPSLIKAQGKRIMLLLLLLLFTNVTLAVYLAHYIPGDFLNCPLMLFLEIFHLKEILVDFFSSFYSKKESSCITLVASHHVVFLPLNQRGNNSNLEARTNQLT